MKAERRHDLKTNSLAMAIADFPGFMRIYGSRVILGVLIVALAGLLVYNYTTGKTAQDTLSREALSTAAMDIARAKSGYAELGEFFQMIQQRPMLDSRQQALVNQDIEHVVEMVRTNVSDAQKLLADAVNSNDPSVKAEAEVQRGNANLLLAGIPSVPGSTTRPSLNGDRSKEDLWKSAEDSFNQVTHPPLNANAEAVRNARFGLAAVAENRKEWDKARQAYQQIIDDPATPTLFRDQARAQQDALAQIQKPLLTGGMRVVGPLPDWASLPGFGQPSSTPATTPAFAPTTMPAGAPTTLPASIQPASTQPTSTQP